jgi:ABC-type nitrate/sulfonate/bicarbonate transport system permease component
VEGVERPGELSSSSTPQSRNFFRSALTTVVRALPIVLLGVAWEALAMSGAVTPFQLPRLSAVFARILADASSGDLLINTAVTLYRALSGFVIAAVAGVVLGMAMSRNVAVRWLLDPIVSVGFPMPKIAFLPIVILWLGVYDTSKIAMVVLDAIFPVITATMAGIAGIDRHLLWSARNMGASERDLLWQIALPAALPEIMTGLQVALPIALIVTIVAEMLMGGYGLGGAMVHASRFADSRGVFAGIVEIAAIGYVLVRAMALVRHRLLSWHQEALAPSTI